ncbi:hypothetical protein SAMN06297229_0266 [Pseudidiomarina planktonica]|uniref:DUF3784 domain-containing protein n=1 Tax=Pseudidiomarina planktonica TaxID=1323738 RepID=A0A1Y6EAC8_9GAMM|nr:hypothetical protein [Pseudidiomarina planktonica]RUO66242.1 hypothetical protein CWI77_07425 [Pseudidiomarina planktonica]SMQ59439.1 hypothetical protein SAMN06297229_0266 [Pseudidiomarina planktonica]
MNEFGILLVILLVSVPTLVASYLVGVKKKMNMLAGWNPDKYKEHDKIGSIFGRALFALSVLSFIGCAMLYQDPSYEHLFGLMLLLGVVFIIVSAIYCNLKYRKN